MAVNDADGVRDERSSMQAQTTNVLWLLFISLPILAFLTLILLGIYVIYTQPVPTF